MTQEPEYVDVVEDDVIESGMVVSGEMRGQEGFDVMQIAERNSRIMSPELLEAIQELKTGMVDRRYVQKKGGMDYISHPHATRTMNAVFGPHWEFKNLGYELFDDGSVAARCSLKIRWPSFHTSGTYWQEREFIEIGSYSPGKDKETGEIFMSEADRVGSATSRGLLKCMFRAFGYGAFLYKKDYVPMTKEKAWSLLLEYGQKRLALTEKQIITALKKAKITGDDLIDQYPKAMNVLKDIAKDYMDVPEELA